MSRDLVFIDVETTGLFSSDRVVSLAAIRVSPEKIFQPTLEANYCHLVFDPGKKSHPRAEEVHGLDDWFLRHQPQFGEQAGEITTILSGAPIVVAHNVSFDRQFILRELELANLPVEIGGYSCTMAAYREQEAGRASLSAILPRMGLRRSSVHHGAFEDAWLSLQVYRWLHGAIPLKFTEDWPSFSNARAVPPRPDPLPRRSRKKKASAFVAYPLHPAADKLKPYALLLDFVARSDGRVDSEIAVLTEFLKNEEPNMDEAAILDVVAHWIDCELPDSAIHIYAKQVDDRDKLVDWLRRVATADGEVSPSELAAVRTISEALNHH